MDDVLVCHLGRVEYRAALEMQLDLRERVQDGRLGDAMLLLEHPPVYTLGRRGGPADLPMGEAWCRAQGIDVVATDRGGKLTYHGPGQLVGYPIVRVTDVAGYVHALERAMIAALAEEGVAAHAREGREFTGVWVGDRKIASIGVHVQHGVTTHGFAVNVDNDLAPFGWVVPCGLPDVEMTSVARELGGGARLPCFRKRMAYALCRELGRRQRLVSAARLGVRDTRTGAIPSLA
jgi:lipoyl(octanoyl) transferase